MAFTEACWSGIQLARPWLSRDVLIHVAGRKKRRAARQSTDLGPLPSPAENPMAIMSYQPLDEQLSTQFLNLLGDGGLDPLRPGGPGLAGVWQAPAPS